MPDTTPVTLDLDRRRIPYQLHLHPGPIRSLEQAAQERGLLPDQIIRSLVFRLEGEVFIMVLMPGPKRVSWPKLRHHLGISRLTTASEDEVEAITGYQTGAVSPFGILQPIRKLADWRICENETISIGAGIRNAGVIMTRDDLIQAIDLEFGDFSL
jgi:Cys-tRNA(Pro)/Cys-tRNA(Cys) deacylase